LTTQVLSAPAIERQLWQAFDQRNDKLLAQCARELTTSFSDYDSGWYSLSQIAYKQKNIKRAFQLIAEAIKLKPSNAAYQLHQVMLISSVGDYDQAKKFMAKVDTSQFKTGYQYATAGRIYSAIEQQNLALECYKQAVKLEPSDPGHHYNLAAVARFNGDMMLARSSLDICLNINKYDAQAAYLMSQLPLSNEQVDDLKIVLQRQAENKSASPRDRVYNQFSQGALYESRNEYEQAFACFSEANKTRRAHIKYSIKDDIFFLSRLKKLNRDHSFKLVKESSSQAAPIFLLGLPRTGSTLIERAITSGTGIYSAGEPNSFNVAMQREAKAILGRPCTDANELLDTVKDFNYDRLADAYMQSYNVLPKGYSTHIDKLPMNSLNLAIIAKSFPKAKLIYLERNPADTLYAIYKTLFENAYPFSYTLDELARYIVAHRALMESMKSLLAERLLVIRYEDFVLDHRQQLNRLAEYLEIPASKLGKHQDNMQASSTASSTQVRQAIHTKSVELYKKVVGELAEGLSVFDQAGLSYE